MDYDAYSDLKPFISVVYQGYEIKPPATYGTNWLKNVVYDLSIDEELKLEDIFMANTDYLKRISDYAIKTLPQELYNKSEAQNQENLVLIKKGAAPEIENFRTFAITKKALIIYFNEFQVGDYALGTPSLEIPWRVVKEVLNTEIINPENLEI